jgi:hypothetical protein
MDAALISRKGVLFGAIDPAICAGERDYIPKENPAKEPGQG